MTISVCIPCYNRPEYAREAIISAWEQCPRPLEILVGDDSSNDDTRIVVEALKSEGLPIRYFRNAPRIGQSRNVARLFSVAGGDVVSLMHDDDRFRPGAFENLIQPMLSDEKVAAVFGKQVVISDGGVENWESTSGLNETHARRDAGVVSDSVVAGVIGMFPNNGYFVRRDAICNLDYHDDGKASTACDWYFGVRLGMTKGKFYMVDAFTCDYRLSDKSVGRNGSDAAYHVLVILSEFIQSGLLLATPPINRFFASRIKGAIASAAVLDRRLGWRWYFSRWHRCSIFTLGGIRRLLLLLGICKA